GHDAWRLAPSPSFRPQRRQRGRGVLRRQGLVVPIVQLAGRSIELDFLQGTQRHGAGTGVLFGILAFGGGVLGRGGGGNDGGLQGEPDSRDRQEQRGDGLERGAHVSS